MSDKATEVISQYHRWVKTCEKEWGEGSAEKIENIILSLIGIQDPDTASDIEKKIEMIKRNRDKLS
jgi:hypothetical protein